MTTKSNTYPTVQHFVNNFIRCERNKTNTLCYELIAKNCGI